MRRKFKNADEAYCYFLNEIRLNGVEFGGTKALFNVGFTLEKPDQNYIVNDERDWKLSYAMAEWDWYLSGDPNIKKLGKIYGKVPQIWERMADKYYAKDTPCTYAVQFTILNNRLNMAVLMRSNDLWYGFCNDQYQFSMLQMMVAERLNIEIGEYYHYAHNLHLYNNKL